LKKIIWQRWHEEVCLRQQQLVLTAVFDDHKVSLVSSARLGRELERERERERVNIYIYRERERGREGKGREGKSIEAYHFFT
jgi:hypothetical protein